MLLWFKFLNLKSKKTKTVKYTCFSIIYLCSLACEIRSNSYFVVYSTRRSVVCLTMCHFVLVFFSPFSIAITSLGEERTNLSAFRTFVRFVLVWICRFPLPLGVWEGLRFMIVALPGLFSYLFSILATGQRLSFIIIVLQTLVLSYQSRPIYSEPHYTIGAIVYLSSISISLLSIFIFR